MEKDKWLIAAVGALGFFLAGMCFQRESKDCVTVEIYEAKTKKLLAKAGCSYLLAPPSSIQNMYDDFDLAKRRFDIVVKVYP